MLDKSIIEQLNSVFAILEGDYTLVAEVAANHPSHQELTDIISDIASCSTHIGYEVLAGESLKLYIRNNKNNEVSPFLFKAVPTGHEFSSLVIALLNFDGKGKNIPDELLQQKIKSLKGEHLIQSFISLSCTNCPEVVQALNIISILNPNIKHEIIDGAIYTSEADALGVQAVPSAFCNDKLIHVGKSSLGALIEKLESLFGTEELTVDITEKEFDVIVVGGGPAGASAAIYSARKGLNVAIIADRIGGQVKETVGIENLISTIYTTGNELADNLHKHITSYPISVFENRKVISATPTPKGHTLELQSKERFSAPAIIVATGAGWRKLNVPGEQEYIGRGVAFCPHCDGPFYKDKEVAVVGGGNSGIEAAIDLAGICKKVTVIEFMDTLKADKVLQEQAISRSNIEIITHHQVMEVVGNKEKVTSLQIKDRATNEIKSIDLSAVFVQIGLTANSLPFKGLVEMSAIGEIAIDEKCRTSAKGIYAAGDVSTVPYKQIIIAMGEGAKAGLSAFEDRINGTLAVN